MRDEDLERLYAQHAGPLFSFLAYRTGDRAMAEDLLADTFERVLRSRRRFDPRKGGEKTWIYSIALNLLRDRVRRGSIEARALETVHSRSRSQGSESLDALEARDEISRAMAALTPEEREAIALRFGADLSLREIADVTGEKQTTVEGRVYRALRKMRDELE